MTTRLNLNDDESQPDRRRATVQRRQAEPTSPTAIIIELMKLVFPVLLAWGVAYMTSRSEAVEAAKTEIAVVKNTEQLHFDEIQRTLHRLDEWITRQEDEKRRGPK